MTSSGRHREPDTGDREGAALPVGTEDVLNDAEPAPEEDTRAAPPARARRSPWNRRRDRVIAALLAVIAVAGAVLVWVGSDSRATIQQTADGPPPLPGEPADVPATLTEAWRAPSPATPEPVAEESTVVTGSGGEVAGRDPRTGEVRWRYARDLALCTVEAEWTTALAVYRKDTGCSEVTQLDPATGARTGQRNGDAELGTRLVGDGGHVTTTGDRLLNTWRNDLVKSLEFGRVYATVNPERQPRPNCTYGTVAAASGRVGVIERCPNETGARLTVLKAAGEEADEPEQVFSQPLPERTAKLVAMSGAGIAVVLPQSGQLALYDPEGQQRRRFPLDVPAADLAREPEDGVMPTATGAEHVYWFTGSSTMALSRKDLTPQWTVRGTLGPGTSYANRYVVPIEGGLAVLDESTGETIRTVGVDRRGYRGDVELAAAGPVLLEQRGGTVVALR